MHLRLNDSAISTHRVAVVNPMDMRMNENSKQPNEKEELEMNRLSTNVTSNT